MKAVRYYGKEDIRVERVPDPQILNPRDAIVKITTTAICGSDLHIYGGYIPTMEKGDILGHEFMGEVVEVGRENHRLKVGDRVVVPFTIACGRCYFCKENLWSLCDNSNPNAWMAEKLSGFSGSGLFGYSHMYGGYPGGQAEYARVPFADVGPIKVPDSLSDEQVLFLSDIFPTGYMAAENCGIRPGDTIAVWGCGPVGQFAIKSAYLLGAERVIAIDRFPERLELAASAGKAVPLNYTEVDVPGRTARDDRRPGARRLHRRRRPRSARHDARRTGTTAPRPRRISRPIVRTRCARRSPPAARAARSRFPASTAAGSTSSLSAPAFAKGLTLKMGQTHMHKYLPRAARARSSAARSTPRSSSPTASRSTTHRRCTRRFARSRIGASRS